jgi:type IV fimbrial biogenesis protein FimT
MDHRQQLGFTLWELLMTLLVAGILIGIGVPNMMELQRNSAMTAAANQLVTGLLLARTEAVKRQVPVGVCLSANPTAANPVCSPNGVLDATNLGFVVWVDENNNFVNGSHVLTDATDGNGVIDPGEDILMQEAAPGGTMLVSTNCGNVSYGANGFTRTAAALCNPPAGRAFLFCDDRGRRLAAGSLSSARVVTVDRPGRGQVIQEKVAIDPVIGALGANCP